jgi:hypothetical protein
MLKRLGHRWLRHFSRRYQYDTTYLEELLDCSTMVFLKFSALHLLSSHRRGIPVAPWSAARIRATMHEDCGPCTQLVCNMALEAGVDPAVIAAVVTADLNALDAETALAVQFTELVMAHDPAADVLREQIRLRWGDAGLISLALTISTTRVYPNMKYALGHGQVCNRVQVSQRSAAPIHYASATLGASSSAARIQ